MDFGISCAFCLHFERNLEQRRNISVETEYRRARQRGRVSFRAEYKYIQFLSSDFRRTGMSSYLGLVDAKLLTHITIASVYS